MRFSERDKLLALAIVNIFETGKLADFSAVAVLNDGAGISYGFAQFTHKSGSLYAVLSRFQKLGGELPEIIKAVMPSLKAGTLIGAIAARSDVKAALRKLGADPLMQRAQIETATELYLKPAVKICDSRAFSYPLSLTVIYDSLVHGSFAKIAGRVRVQQKNEPPDIYEKAWIREYLRCRREWLSSIARLKPTVYRIDELQKLVAAGNWDLTLPITVRGVRLTKRTFAAISVLPNSPTDRNIDRTVDSVSQPVDSSQSSTNQSSPDPADMAIVHREKPSLFTRIGAAITALTGLGINVGTVIQSKVEQLTLAQTAYLLAALGLVALAIWWYRKSAKAAQIRTLALVEAASDPRRATVVLSDKEE
ncbi:MAG: hypothetical protein C4287_23250 [Leptolyngbya sp. ERB_1_2]